MNISKEEALKNGTKVIVMKVEIDTDEQEMFFTDEMAQNIGCVVTISKSVEYLDDFYTIEGDDNYNAYHISWLHIFNQAPVLDKDIEEALKYLQGSSIHNDDIYAQESLSAIKLALQSVDTKTLKVDETHLESSQHITSDEIVKDFLMENKDD